MVIGRAASSASDCRWWRPIARHERTWRAGRRARDV